MNVGTGVFRLVCAGVFNVLSSLLRISGRAQTHGALRESIICTALVVRNLRHARGGAVLATLEASNIFYSLPNLTVAIVMLFEEAHSDQALYSEALVTLESLIHSKAAVHPQRFKSKYLILNC